MGWPGPLPRDGLLSLLGFPRRGWAKRGPAIWVGGWGGRGTHCLPSPGFLSQLPFREASPAQRCCLRAPGCSPHCATPGEVIAEGTTSDLVAPGHHPVRVLPGSLPLTPSQQTWPPQPVPRLMGLIHSFTHVFNKCLPNARTTCEVLC